MSSPRTSPIIRPWAQDLPCAALRIWRDLGGARGVLLSLRRCGMGRGTGRCPPCRSVVQNWQASGSNAVKCLFRRTYDALNMCDRVCILPHIGHCVGGCRPPDFRRTFLWGILRNLAFWVVLMLWFWALFNLYVSGSTGGMQSAKSAISEFCLTACEAGGRATSRWTANRFGFRRADAVTMSRSGPEDAEVTSLLMSKDIPVAPSPSNSFRSFQTF